MMLRLSLMWKVILSISCILLTTATENNSDISSTTVSTTVFVVKNDTDSEQNSSTDGNETDISTETNITDEPPDNTSDVKPTTIIPETTTTQMVLIDDPKSRERSLKLEDFCLCDLTESSCDINCCCDKDCSEIQKKVFSYCKKRMTNYLDQQYCIQEEILYKNNTPYPTKVQSKDLLCVVTDNLRDRNLYPVIRGANSMEDYLKLVERKGYFSWDKSLEADEELGPKLNIQGSLMWTIDRGGHTFPFELPFGYTSTECREKENVLYLEEYSSKCPIQLRSLSSQCEEEVLFSAASFSNFEFIVMIPSEEEPPNDKHTSTSTTTTTTAKPTTKSSETSVNSSTSEPPSYDTESIDVEPEVEISSQPLKQANPQLKKTENLAEKTHNKTVFNRIHLTKILCQDSSKENCSEVDILPAPVFENGSCRNVLENVHFTFVHKGIYGIVEVIAQIQVRSISFTTPVLRQEYAVSFEWMEDNVTEILHRSGSPGYIQGMPVLIGFLQSNDSIEDDSHDADSWIHLDKTPNNWVTIVSIGSDSHCSEKTIVNFREDIYSSCLYVSDFNQTSVKSCSSLKMNILSLLLGPLHNSENKLRVGMYGDSHINKTEEWLTPILADDLLESSSTDKPETHCSNIVSSVGIEIAYAFQGPFSNPQAKIVGVVVKPTKFDNFGFKSKQSSFSIVLELSTIVKFIDVTKDAEREYPEAPSFDLKLPYDFFYPLMPSTGSTFHTCSDHIWIIISLLNIVLLISKVI